MISDYEYEIQSVQVANVNSLTNVVVSVAWAVTGIDQLGNRGTFTGITPYPLDDVDTDTFIPFESLTESTIISWVKDTIGNDALYFQHINDQIENQINVKLAPTLSPALPWATNN